MNKVNDEIIKFNFSKRFFIDMYIEFSVALTVYDRNYVVFSLKSSFVFVFIFNFPYVLESLLKNINFATHHSVIMLTFIPINFKGAN